MAVNRIVLDAMDTLKSLGITVEESDIELFYWDGMSSDELVKAYRSFQIRQAKEQAREILRPKRKNITKAVRKQVWLKYGGRCAYCGTPVPLNEMEVDHIYPLSMGGEDDYKNYAPACHACNNFKASTTLEGFRNKLLAIQSQMNKNPLYRLAISYKLIQNNTNNVNFYFETHKV